MNRLPAFLALLLFIPANFQFAASDASPDFSLLLNTAFQGKEHPTTEQEEWTYKGPKGPVHWGEKFPDCAHAHQSPIDIETARSADLPAIEFHYQPSPLYIMNNGHTIQVSFPPGKTPGNTIKIGNEEYKLLQFHFHQPSEEIIHGKAKDMVVHLVHGRGEGPNQRLAVVAVLFQRTAGLPNQLLGTLWQHIPKKASHEVEAVPGIEIDPSGFLPGNRSYYTYSGSLTTPPCSEIVTWYILKDALPISSMQLATFEKYYMHNARPAQPVNGRTVLQSK